MKDTEMKVHGKSETEAEVKVERHLAKIQQAKNAVMKAAGLPDIDPIENGRWDMHVKLSEIDADRIIEEFGGGENLLGRRKKRQGLWFYANQSYEWPNGVIPYAIDPSFSKKIFKLEKS